MEPGYDPSAVCRADLSPRPTGFTEFHPFPPDLSRVFSKPSNSA
jgi:hypothetical protein